MKFSLKTLIWTVVLVALVLAGAFAFMPRPAEVEFATVVEGPLVVTVQEDGKTRIREKYVVSAPVVGRLARIELEPGDNVEADATMLAVIQPSEPTMLDARAQAEAEARVRGAEAALQRSQANLEQEKINNQLHEANFQRVKRLADKNAVSPQEFDVANAAFQAGLQAIKSASFDAEIATFELQMAQAAASQFQDDAADNTAIEPFEIRAPVSGKVLRVFQESAAVVSVGTPLLELGDPQKLEIEIDVLSTDAVRIQPGAEVTVEHWGGAGPLQGAVRIIEPAAFTKVSSLGVEEQRVNIIADFSSAGEPMARLGDGYRVEARVTVDALEKALLIPNSSVFRYRRKWHVFLVKDDVAIMQPVTLGLQNESFTNVEAGLSVGDRVIVYPSEEIGSGTRVRPIASETE